MNPEDEEQLWNSSSSSQQIKKLIQVEKDIAKLLQHASTSLQLLRISEDNDEDGSEDKDGNALRTRDAPLPDGEERVELFVAEATAYFETLNSIQTSMRRTLAHIRSRRISPASINAPASNAIPRAYGAGSLPNQAASSSGLQSSEQSSTTTLNANLQEARVERDAWRGIAEALNIAAMKNDSDAEKNEDEIMQED